MHASRPPPAKKSKLEITYYPPPPGYTGPARPPGSFPQTGRPQIQAQPTQHFPYGQTAYSGYQNQGYGAHHFHQQPTYPGQYTAPQQPTPRTYNAQMNHPAYYPPPQSTGHAGWNLTQQWNGTAQQYPPNAQPHNASAYQHYANAQWNSGAHEQNNNVQQHANTQQYGSYPTQANGSAPHPNASMTSPAYAGSPPAPASQPGSALPDWQQQNQNNRHSAGSSQQRPRPPWAPPASYNSLPRHNSAPSISSTVNLNAPIDENDGNSLPWESGYVSVAADNLESPYYGAECPFAHCPDEIDPNLSLGDIVYHPALPTLRPLPSTHQKAEIEAIAPRPPQATDHESISEYFINSRRESNLLDVRQTDYWDAVRDDPIFHDFIGAPEEYVSPEEMRANWRDRPDLTWTEVVGSPTPEPEETMEVDVKSEEANEDSDPLSNLEQALENGSNSFGSQRNQSIDRPRAMGIIRDRAQEDVLAALGVTGSPKMAYQTPGPAYSSNNSASSARPRGSLSYPVPPPPPPGSPPNGHRRRLSRGEQSQDTRSGWADLRSQHTRRGSAGSNHTAAGSDFASENEQNQPDLDRTPRAAPRAENRKRGHDDGEDDGAAGGSGAENDTPRPGRKAARFES